MSFVGRYILYYTHNLNLSYFNHISTSLWLYLQGFVPKKLRHENPKFFWCQTQPRHLGSGQEWHQLGIELHLGTRIKPCTWCVYYTIIHIYMVWYVNILHTIKIHITFVQIIPLLIYCTLFDKERHTLIRQLQPQKLRVECVASWAVAITDDIWGPICSLLILIFGRMNSTRLIHLGNGKPSNYI